MDSWRQCCRLDKIKNVNIKVEMEIEFDIIETIEVTILKLVWTCQVNVKGLESYWNGHHLLEEKRRKT